MFPDPNWPIPRSVVEPGVDVVSEAMALPDPN
jgi:hypothetical protein